MLLLTTRLSSNFYDMPLVPVTEGRQALAASVGFYTHYRKHGDDVEVISLSFWSPYFHFHL